MMRLIFIGLWSAMLTVCCAYGTAAWKAKTAAPEHAEAGSHDLSQVKLKLLSVPIISSGVIQGYVLANLTFTVNSAAYKTLPEPAGAFLNDEAFRQFYSVERVDFKNMKKQDLAALTKSIAASVNARLKADVVKDVLIDELNYVPKVAARGGR